MSGKVDDLREFVEDWPEVIDSPMVDAARTVNCFGDMVVLENEDRSLGVVLCCVFQLSFQPFEGILVIPVSASSIIRRDSNEMKSVNDGVRIGGTRENGFPVFFRAAGFFVVVTAVKFMISHAQKCLSFFWQVFKE